MGILEILAQVGPATVTLPADSADPVPQTAPPGQSTLSHGFAALLHAERSREVDTADAADIEASSPPTSPVLPLDAGLELTSTVPARLLARPPIVSAVITFDGAVPDSTATHTDDALPPPGVSELLAAVAPPVVNPQPVVSDAHPAPSAAPGGLRELLVSPPLDQPPEAVVPPTSEAPRELPASPAVLAMLEAAGPAFVDPPGEPGSATTVNSPVTVSAAPQEPSGSAPRAAAPDLSHAADPPRNTAPPQPTSFAAPTSIPPTPPGTVPAAPLPANAPRASFGVLAELAVLPAAGAAAQDGESSETTQPPSDGPDTAANLPSPGTSRSTTTSSGSRPPTLATQLNPAEFVERLAQTFLEAHRAGRPLQVRLHPPERGLLQIELSRHDGLLTARLEVETSAARQTILDQLPQLREALVQTGSRLERIEVHLLERSDDRPHDGAGRRQPSDQPADDRQPRRRPSAHHRTDHDHDPPSRRPTTLERLDIQI